MVANVCYLSHLIVTYFFFNSAHQTQLKKKKKREIKDETYNLWL